jgi:hypothetical protein
VARHDLTRSPMSDRRAHFSPRHAPSQVRPDALSLDPSRSTRPRSTAATRRRVPRGGAADAWGRRARAGHRPSTRGRAACGHVGAPPRELSTEQRFAKRRAALGRARTSRA